MNSAMIFSRDSSHRSLSAHCVRVRRKFEKLCAACNEPVSAAKCSRCKGRKLRYSGLIVHDLRRSAARELRKAGVAESVVMSIGGWKTAAMFRRYAITDTKDIASAIAKREQARIEANSHNSPSGLQSEAKPANLRVN